MAKNGQGQFSYFNKRHFSKKFLTFIFAKTGHYKRNFFELVLTLA